MWGSSHSHLSVICFLKSCAVTLTKQPLGLFRCCVSSEETESYALPLNPSTPSAQFISTNTQQHCFTRFFNSNQFQNHRRTAYKRPVTTAATNQNSVKKTSKNYKLAEIHHHPHKTLPTKPVLPSNYYKSNLLKQPKFMQITQSIKNRTHNN